MARSCGLAVVQQASLLDGLLLDASALLQDGLTPAEVDGGGGEIVQALVRAAVIVVTHKGRELAAAVGSRPAGAEDLWLICAPQRSR